MSATREADGRSGPAGGSAVRAPVTGALVLVVGPSGAGKDTLISYARARLAGRDDVCFARRIVTRAADATLEDHDTLSPEAFAERAARGDFALHWRAHGLCYALPACVDEALAAGRTVVANVSRGAVEARLSRAVEAPLDDVVVIDNAGPVAVAGEAFVALVERTRPGSPVPLPPAPVF